MAYPWGRYGLALLATAAAWLLSQALAPWLQPRSTPLFFLATVVSARYGGLGPGLLASSLSTLILVYYYIPPLYTFTTWEVSELVQAVVFLAATAIVSSLSAQRRHALATARATAERVARLQDITAALSRTAAPNELFDVVVKQGASLLRWKTAAIFLVADDSQALRLVRAFGYPPEVLAEAAERPVSGSSPSAEVVRTGQPLWITSQREFSARYPHIADLRATIGNEASAVIPLAVDDHVLGTLVISFGSAWRFPEEDKQFLLTLGRQCALALERGRLYEHERRSRLDLETRVQQATTELRAANASLQREIAERRETQQRLENAREAERARIARELHDELGGDLTGLIFSVSWLVARPDLSPDARQQLSTLVEDIEATLWSVRRLATELHPLIIQRMGLLGALEWQFSEFLARTDLEGEFTCTLEEIPLADEPATACFRIFQEALTNVARHAQATRVEARLEAEGNQIVLRIEDNGEGMPDTAGQTNGGLGLASMRERAELLGAELAVASRPGRGTAVVLKLPVHGLEQFQPP